MEPVAVLGCGPAGLMAVQALRMLGVPCAVMSKKKKSRIGGAQFLHKAIPDVTNEEPDGVITYRVQGDALGYRAKVYGEDDPTTNPDHVSMEFIKDGQQQDIWNLQAAYDRLWQWYEDDINDVNVTPMLLNMWQETNTFSMVINTIPLPIICKARAGLVDANHRFTLQEIGVVPDWQNMEPMTITYNGTPHGGWYRASSIFGVTFAEYSVRSQLPPIPGIVRIQKPIRNFCDCWQDYVVRAGRYGAWTKGVLTHDAFETTIKALVERVGAEMTVEVNMNGKGDPEESSEVPAGGEENPPWTGPEPE